MAIAASEVERLAGRVLELVEPHWQAGKENFPALELASELEPVALASALEDRKANSWGSVAPLGMGCCSPGSAERRMARHWPAASAHRGTVAVQEKPLGMAIARAELAAAGEPEVEGTPVLVPFGMDCPWVSTPQLPEGSPP